MMDVPDFIKNSPNITLEKGKKITDKMMVNFGGHLIMPAEIAKIVLVLLLLEDDKHPKPKQMGGDVFEQYLNALMQKRKYFPPPKTSDEVRNLQKYIDKF